MYHFCFHEKKVYATTLCLCVMADGVPQIIFGLGPRKAIIRPWLRPITMVGYT